MFWREKNKAYYWEQGDARFKAKKYEKAIKAYLRALDFEDDYALYFNIGNCFYNNDELPRAIDNYEKALKLNPKYDKARSMLLGAYLTKSQRYCESSEFLKATNLLKKALEVASEDENKQKDIEKLLLVVNVAQDNHKFINEPDIRKEIREYVLRLESCRELSILRNMGRLTEDEFKREINYSIEFTYAAIKEHASSYSCSFRSAWERIKLANARRQEDEWVKRNGGNW